jgi:glycosyltransferase involved in cell wall biosynthesis
MFKIAKLFESKGHEIAYFSMADPQNVDSQYNDYFVSNVDYNETKAFSTKIKQAVNIIFNREARHKFEKVIKEFKPDLIQVHNIYHHLSVSIVEIAKEYGVPIFKFLHDYKVVCPVYTLITHGRMCEGKCRNNQYFWCTLRKCNDSNLFKSLTNTLEMYANNVYPNYYGMIDLFISPSKFLAEKVLSMGFKPKHIVTLPHFMETKGIVPSYCWKNKEILYFGRISKEKGIRTLIQAVKGVDVVLKIIGSGPLHDDLCEFVKREAMPNVVFIPHMPHIELLKQVGDCMFTVLPSECYENCPNTVMESFACGKPVIGARIGGIPEMVIDNQTGLTFKSGNADDLREKILQLIANSDEIVSFGKNARCFVETQLSPERYYDIFMQDLNAFQMSKT